MTRRGAFVILLAACGGSSSVDGDAPADPPDAPVDDRAFTLREVGRQPLLDQSKLVVSGNRLYAKVDTTELMVIFDLADPAAPARVGAFAQPPNVSGADARLAVSGNVAYLAHESDGILIVDISDPANPTMISQFTDNTYPKDVAFANNKLFIADQDSGLVIADVTDPSAPVRVGAVTTDGPFGVIVAGDRALLADNDAGFKIADVSVPGSPQILGMETSIGSSRSVAVLGDTAFALGELGNGNALYAIDVSAPSTPAVVGTYPTASEDEVVVDGNHLLVCGSAGLEVLTATATPVLVTSVALGAESPRTVAATATHVYVGTGFATAELVTFEKVF